jgi:DNA replication licensing factor MCM7
MQQRRFNAVNAQQAMIAQGLMRPGEQQNGQGLSKMGIPPELERNYHLSIVPGGALTKKTFVKMREIKASSVGGLVSVKGIVTRVSDVKPCM